MKNNIYKIALVLSAFVLVLACEDSDDFTGDSVSSPSSPALSVSLDFASSQSLVETEADYAFTVSLSQPQITAVVVYLELLPSSTATEGDDFSFPHSVRIPAGATSVSDVITIHADDLIEETESASIKIGTGFEANVTATNSETVTFNIMNFTEGDLAVGLDWELASTITDNYGEAIDVYDAADLRLLLTDVPYTTIFDSADGASAETYVLDGAAPDGEYYLVADFYAASDIAVDLNLTLTFDQTGVINGQTHTFPAALNTGDICADLNYVLAKVTKTGNSYAFEEVGEKSEFDVALFAGDYSELSDTNVNGWLTDGATMTVGDNPNELLVEGIYYGLFNYWGEAFQPGFGNEGLVTITLNADGSVTFPDQYVGQTLPGPYDYYYNGSGSYSLCDKTITLSFAMQFDDTYSDDYQPATIVFQLD